MTSLQSQSTNIPPLPPSNSPTNHVQPLVLQLDRWLFDKRLKNASQINKQQNITPIFFIFFLPVFMDLYKSMTSSICHLILFKYFLIIIIISIIFFTMNVFKQIIIFFHNILYNISLFFYLVVKLFWHLYLRLNKLFIKCYVLNCF